MLWRTMGFLCFGSVQLERKCTNWSQLLTMHKALASVRLLFLSLKQSAEGGSTAQCNVGGNAKNVWSNFSSPNYQGLRVSCVLFFYFLKFKNFFLFVCFLCSYGWPLLLSKLHCPVCSKILPLMIQIIQQVSMHTFSQLWKNIVGNTKMCSTCSLAFKHLGLCLCKIGGPL